MADGLVRPVIFDALVQELGFGPLVPGPVGAGEAVPVVETFQALPRVEPRTEPFPTVEVSPWR